MSMTAEEVAASTALTNLKKNVGLLEYREDQMRKGLLQYATNLKEIRDLGCWRLPGDPYGSFDDYCRKKLGFSQARASQIITATNVMALMVDVVKDEPEVAEAIQALPETVFRELKEIPPEKAVEVVKAIATKEKVTSVSVRKALNPVSEKIVTFVPEKPQKPNINPEQWLELGRKVPAFQAWWQTQTNQEQSDFIQHLEQALRA